ncbi:MAG: FAD-binding protein, partial [Candidatus Heimdallarchaeaceae archaeon]
MRRNTPFTPTLKRLFLFNNSMNSYDYTTDVLVVGSGGGGMTAALVAKKGGLDVLVIEK